MPRVCVCVSLQELILPLLLLALLIAINNLNPHSYYGDISTVELEREDRSFKGLGYTPITNVTSSIMEQVAQEMSQYPSSPNTGQTLARGLEDCLDSRCLPSCFLRHAVSSGDVCH